MKYILLPFYLLFLLSSHIVSAQQDQDLQNYYLALLKVNGVSAAADLTTIPYVDIKRIADYNFDRYRAYDTKQQVKLKGGPIIDLTSLNDRVAAGFAIDSSTLAQKKSIASMHYAHSIMPLLDIQLGSKAPVKHKEKTTYFMNSKANN